MVGLLQLASEPLTRNEEMNSEPIAGPLLGCRDHPTEGAPANENMAQLVGQRKTEIGLGERCVNSDEGAIRSDPPDAGG